jgi:hypothetical protein
MPGKSSSLTGGSGDVNPQWYKFTLTDPLLYTAPNPPGSTTSDWVSQAFPVPIQRTRVNGQKAWVMEVLKIRWQLGTNSNAGVSAPKHYSGGQTNTSAFLTTKQYTAAPGGGEGPVIDQRSFTINEVGAVVSSDASTPPYWLNASPGAFWESPLDVTHDLTDGAGHGVIVATDNVYLGMNTVLTANGIIGSPTNGDITFDAFLVEGIFLYCWLLYRFKEVGLTEYIGVVQSQQ